jgi:hypothetical protein
LENNNFNLKKVFMEHFNFNILKKQKVLLKNIIIGLLLIIPFLVNGQDPPTISTLSVTEIETTSAKGWGFISDIGTTDVTAHGFCWSTSSGPTLSDSHTDEGGTAIVIPFTTILTNLTPGTTYYYRAYATNSSGTSYGSENSFTTLKVPTLTTQAVSDIDQTTATGNGNLTDLGIPNPTAHGICWSTSTNPTKDDFVNNLGAAASPGAFSAGLTSLIPGTEYFVRAYATNNGGTAYGNELSFKSLNLPSVTTQAISDITQTTATGNGNITDLGVPNPSQYGVCWNTTGTPTTSDNKTTEGPADVAGFFTSSISGLIEGTTYYVRAYATNTQGTVYGNEVSFSTIIPPIVTTQAVSDLTSTTATGNGNISFLGVPDPTSHGVCWGLSADPTLLDNYTDEGSANSTGEFTSSITGLTGNTTYHIRAYATNSAGTVYGNDLIFTTYLLPTVSTEAVSDIDQTTATGNGTISDLGIPDPSAHGVCWSTSPNPTTDDNFTNELGASSTGAFVSNISGLTAGTQYYVRAYATNLIGTVYGNEVSFTTLKIPTVTTEAVSAINQTTATGNGTLTDLGVPNPTAYGVCWNTIGTPTIENAVSDLGGASITGPFTAGMTGLTPGTLYYVRAFATNTDGTVYGNEVTFTTQVLPAVTTQAVTSISYNTATGNGNITNLGIPNPTAYGVCWSTSTSPTTSNNHTDESGASATGAFTSNITGLNVGTLYYVRAYATNDAGTVYGNQVSFSTLSSTPPTLATSFPINITDVSATGRGNIYTLGIPNPVAHGVCWNTTGTPTISNNKTNEGEATATGTFSSSITGLNANTTYYVRAYATSITGVTIYGGSGISFTTNKLPVVNSTSILNLNATSAEILGEVTDLGSPTATAHGFCWNTTGTPSILDDHTDEGIPEGGGFTSNISGLIAGQTYYIRAYATNSVGTAYGSELIFRTLVLPSVTTQAVTDIFEETATGNGTITDLGVPNPSAYGVCWNTTGAPEITDNLTNEGVAVATGAFTSNMTGLSSGVTYYVRAYATNSEGTFYGEEVSFGTQKSPVLSTDSITNIVETTATAYGNITDLGIPNPTAHGFCWSTSPNPTTSDSYTDELEASSPGLFSSSISGLTAGTLYYIRAYATNSLGTVYGNELSFTTLRIPTVTTQAVTSISYVTATGNGNITDLGFQYPTSHGICWNTTGMPTTANNKVDLGATSTTGAFNAGMTNLANNTVYYVRAFAKNDAGTVYGSQVSFRTLTSTPPTLATSFATDITDVSATGNGNIFSLGVPNPVAHGFCWNTTGTPTISDNKTDKGEATSTGIFTSSITGLTANTTYYIRAYATSVTGVTVYGGAGISFTTNKLPVVNASSILNLFATSAEVLGEVTDLGFPTATAHGFCWNTTGTPSILDDHTDEGIPAGGGFTSNITGLIAGQTYYIRAYATNSNGTAYSNELNFRTLVAPTVTTQSVTDIAATTATGNGNITDLGVPDPTEYGVCWNTTGAPDTNDSKTTEGTASSTGAFTSSITGLSAGITYYVKAYATNTQGTVYGNEVSFTTIVVDATWTGNTNTDWATASNWNPSGMPTSAMDVLITDVGNDPVIGPTTDADCKDLYIVGSSANLTIESDEYGSGSLIVSGTSSGNVNVERYMSGGVWHVISSSVPGEPISNFLSKGELSYHGPTMEYGMTDYDEPSGWNDYFTASQGGVMTAGKGFLARRDASGVLTFSGSVNTSSVNIAVDSSALGYGWNCIGNPYTSPIGITNASTDPNFLSANIDILSLTHAGIYIYDPTKPATYQIINNTSSTGGDTLDMDYVQPGQGFFIKAKGSGNATFTTGMQTHNNSSNFYKKAANSNAWVSVVLNISFEDLNTYTKVLFRDDMTNGLDITYDAGTFNNASKLKLYTHLVSGGNTDFAIQCLPTNDFENMTIPVGVDFPEGGKVNFTSKIANLPAGTKLILEDRDLQVYTDLQPVDASYTVSLPAETEGIGRFFLHTYDPTAVSTELKYIQNITTFAYNKIIHIQGMVPVGARAGIYDMSGKVMKIVELNAGALNLIPAQELKSGIYIVKISGKNLEKVTKLVLE